MTGNPGSRRMIAILGTEPALPQLERIVGLAERLQCEIRATFMEDVALLWSAALPFTRLIARSGASEPAFEPAAVRRALRLMAEDVHLRLAELARSRRLHCSFTLLAASELRTVVEERDLLLLTAAQARLLAALPRPPELPASLPLVLLGETRGPLLVIYAGNERVLQLARNLAAGTGSEILLLALAEEAGTARQRLQEARQRLGDVRIREDLALTFAPDPLKQLPPDLIQKGVGLAIVDGAVAGRLLAGLAELLHAPRARDLT